MCQALLKGGQSSEQPPKDLCPQGAYHLVWGGGEGLGDLEGNKGARNVDTSSWRVTSAGDVPYPGHAKHLGGRRESR